MLTGLPWCVQEGAGAPRALGRRVSGCRVKARPFLQQPPALDIPGAQGRAGCNPSARLGELLLAARLDFCQGKPFKLSPLMGENPKLPLRFRGRFVVGTEDLGLMVLSLICSRGSYQIPS